MHRDEMKNGKIRKLGFTIGLWNVHPNKGEQASLFVSCIEPDKPEHTFYF